MQVIYFIFFAKYHYELDNKDIFKKFITLCIAYLIVILIGALPVLPQLMDVLDGGRTSAVLNMSIFFNDFIVNTFNYSYNLGFGIIPIYVIVLGICNYKNNFFRNISLTILIFFSITFFVRMLNGFLYIDAKVYLYFLPLFVLLFGIFIEKSSQRKALISLIITFVIIGITQYSNIIGRYITKTKTVGIMGNGNFYLFVTLVILQAILIICLIYKMNRKVLMPIVLLIVIATTVNNTVIIKNKTYFKAVLSGNWTKKVGKGLYYKQLPTNKVDSINTINPFIYTSLSNKNYVEFYNGAMDYVRNYRSDRINNKTLLNNPLYRYFIGFGNQIETSDKTRSLFYGVDNEYTYKDDLLKIDKDKRSLSLLNAFFTDGSNRTYNSQNIGNMFLKVDVNKVKVDSKSKSKKFEIDIPENLRTDGIIKINSKVNSKNVYRAIIKSGDDYTAVRPVNYYGEKENRDINLTLKITKNTKKIVLTIQNSKNKYSDFEFSIIKNEDIDKLKIPTTKPTDLTVENNSKYSFSINMKTSGYLGSSIFYDKGFKVYDNGKEINKEKVNGFFLGAKLTKGDHKIEITYEQPGFKIGTIVTSVGLLILIFIGVKEYRNRRN
jgi:hypothetical protein